MNFYYRSLPEGRCEIVCTRCFLTVGMGHNADDIRRIENSHTCLAKGAPRPVRCSPSLGEPDSNAAPGAVLVTRSNFETGRFRRLALLLIGSALLLYVLPTVLEFVALRRSSHWFSVIVLGDLAGCACLAIFFRRFKAGMLLYCLLTGIEACLCLFHLAQVETLSWMTDLVPTLVVTVMLLRPEQRNRMLSPI